MLETCQQFLKCVWSVYKERVRLFGKPHSVGLFLVGISEGYYDFVQLRSNATDGG
jgi:hypothetical protein